MLDQKKVKKITDSISKEIPENEQMPKISLQTQIKPPENSIYFFFRFFYKIMSLYFFSFFFFSFVSSFNICILS